MRILGLVAVVLALGACGSQVSSGGAATTPATTPQQTSPAAPPLTTVPPAPVDGKLPGLDAPAPAWHFPAPAPATQGDRARADALQAALGGPVVFAGDATQSWSYTSSTAKATKQAPADARAVAQRVWLAAGADVAALEVSVSPDGTTVTGTERLDGVVSPLPFNVVLAADGAVVSASGHLASPTAAGQLARVGTAAALSRLTAAPAGDDRGEQQPSLQPDAKPAVPPLSPQPTTEPSVVDRLLLPVTGVAETYLVVPAPDGGTWLLPGYRFTFDDGSSRSVLAVTGPPPPEPAPTATSVCGGSNPPACGVEGFVGRPEEQVAAEVAAQGRAYRVAERDGAQQMLTADYSADRVNVAITNGVVTRAWFG